MLRTPRLTRTIRAACLLLVVLTGLLMMPTSIARAATITVTTTLDEMTENSTCSLREAIRAANTNSNAHENNCAAGSATGTDTITLASGATYSLTISGSGEDASMTGDLDIVNNTASTDLIIKPNSGTNAVISQDAATDDRVLETMNGSKVQIKKITIQNGHSASYGGGIAAAGWLILESSMVTANSADTLGGGVFSVNGPLEIIKVTSIVNNSATDGGGVYLNGAIPATISDTGIVDNNAQDGGGIYAANTSTLSMINSEVGDNSAGNNGGGIYTDSSTVTLISTVVDDNGAGPEGGGIYNNGDMTLGANTLVIGNTAFSGAGIANAANLTVDASSILLNDADSTNGIGGGLNNHLSGTASIQNGSAVGSASEGNSAYTGGGIMNGGTLTIDASTVEANHAENSGGGVYIFSGGVDIQNGSSVFMNDADVAGGGVYNAFASLTIDDSEISTNSAVQYGGGIASDGAGATTIIQNGSSIILNESDTAAGFYNGETATISDSFVSANAATTDGGGVINSNGTLTVTGSAFTLNTAVGSGDAIYNQTAVLNAIQATGNCIAGNTATAVDNSTAQSQNFTGNWWGAADGPSGAGPGSGDSVAANIDFSGFLTSEGGTCVDNLLLNGSFETDTTPADGKPDDWTAKKIVLGPDGLDTSESSDGAQSFRFAGNGDGSKLVQELLISGSLGDSYTLTFDAWRSGVNGSGSAIVKVQFVYSDGSKKTYKQKLANGSDVGWVGYTINALAEKNYTKLVVTVQYSKSAGTIWYDNLLLTQD